MQSIVGSSLRIFYCVLEIYSTWVIRVYASEIQLKPAPKHIVTNKKYNREGFQPGYPCLKQTVK